MIPERSHRSEPNGSDDPAVEVGNAAVLIDALRQQIDVVDAKLLYALAQRMSLVKQIGYHKKAALIPIVKIDRFMKLLEDRLYRGRDLQLSESFVRALFELIHQASIDQQHDLMRAAPEKVP